MTVGFRQIWLRTEAVTVFLTVGTDGLQFIIRQSLHRCVSFTLIIPLVCFWARFIRSNTTERAPNRRAVRLRDGINTTPVDGASPAVQASKDSDMRHLFIVRICKSNLVAVHDVGHLIMPHPKRDQQVYLHLLHSAETTAFFKHT